MTLELKCGNALALLKQMASESVHVIVTSPPYWALRNYKIAPSIWGGDAELAEKCRHKFAARGRNKKLHPKAAKHNGFCLKCGAWKGAFGLEPTPELYIKHALMIFKELKRVLRKDGTLWLNMGDVRAASGRGGGGGSFQDGDVGKKISKAENSRRKPVAGYKEKDLIGLPWMLAFALRKQGWYLRMDNLWIKQNPMPESVTDRCTSDHEYVFLLSKSPRYFYDARAIAEPVSGTANERGDGLNPKAVLESQRSFNNGVGWDYADGPTVDGQRPKRKTSAAEKSAVHNNAGRIARATTGQKSEPTEEVNGIRPRRPWNQPGQNSRFFQDRDPQHSEERKTGKNEQTGLRTYEGFNQRYDAAEARNSKQNASFSAAVNDLVFERNKRASWHMSTEGFKGQLCRACKWWYKDGVKLSKPCRKCGNRVLCAACGTPDKDFHIYCNECGKGYLAVPEDGCDCGPTGAILSKPCGKCGKQIWELVWASHYATYPLELPSICLRAGTSAHGVCGKCGAPWKRITESRKSFHSGSGAAGNRPEGKLSDEDYRCREGADIRMGPINEYLTLGWEPTCKCNAETVRATVLDPFCGSGTTGIAASRLNLNFIGLDIKPENILISQYRIEEDAPLFNQPTSDVPRAEQATLALAAGGPAQK